MTSFPKTLYVRRENVDESDEYMSASEDAAAGMDEGDTQDVAVYELKQVVKVTWAKNITTTPLEPDPA